MANHSHVVTDLEITEVANLPQGKDISDNKLYFQTGDQQYFRAVPPMSGETPQQATYLIPTAGGSDAGLRITVGPAVAFRELSNDMDVTVTKTSLAVTSATLKAAETPQKLDIVVSDGDVFSDLKAAVDAITGISSAYDGTESGLGEPMIGFGVTWGGVAQFDLVPVPPINGHVYARKAPKAAFDMASIDDHSSIAAGSSIAADQTGDTDGNVGVESFDAPAGSTFHGIAIPPGTYFFLATARSTNKTIDLHVRHHDVFPASGNQISALGTILGSQESENAQVVTGVFTVTAKRKVWVHIDTAAATDGASLTVWKLR